jgi:protocatechuate 3,4-dioxygenase beta subunit
VRYGVAWEAAYEFDATGSLRTAAGVGPPEGSPDGPAAKPEPPVLRLVKDDVPFAGRVVDQAGRPVKGVTVGVTGLYRAKGEDLTGFVRAVQDEKVDYDDVRLQHTDISIGSDTVRQEELSHYLRAETDAEGRFTVRGVGRERIVWAWVEGPGVRTARVFARTRPGPAIPVEHVHQSPGDVFILYGTGFEYRAEGSVPVAGVVRDRTTKAPVPGALVRTVMVEENYRGRRELFSGIRADIARAVTDRAGRFRLTGLPAGKAALLVVPVDEPYLAAVREIEVPAAAGAEAPIEFSVTRGVWIRGRVTDTRTGRPVPTDIQYFALQSNPHLAGVEGFEGAIAQPFVFRSDADGRYAVPGLPGPGIVAARVRGHGFEDYLLGVGADGIQGGDKRGWMAYFPALPTVCTASQYHALAAVDVPVGGTDAKDVDFKLDTGDTLTGTVLGPDGKPQPVTMMYGEVQTGLVYVPLAHPTAEFRVRHHTPDWPRLLLFAHPEKQLAGSLLVKGPQAKPLSVRLQRAGALTGRILGPDGKPAAGATITGTNMVGTPEEMTGGSPALPLAYYKTDKDGRFRIDGLAPGVKYYGLVLVPTGARLATDVTVGAGETKDLGDLKAGE